MTEVKRVPLYVQLYRQMRRRIESGAWPAGMKLLSVRRQASELGVSKFTIERVYSQLAAEGYIRANNRSRYEVREWVAMPDTKETMQVTITPKWIYRYDFRSAAMDREGFRFDMWRRYFYRTLRREDRLLSYGDERGEYELRSALAQYSADSRDTEAGPEDIVIGSSTQQLLRILAGLLREEHDEIVLAEDAFSLGADTFADEGYRTVTIQSDSLVSELQSLSARLVYVLPSYTYRSSGIMPAQVRSDLLAWTELRKGLIIEDDFDCELCYDGHMISSLQGMGGRHQVVYLGALSRIIPPSFRLAYMILPPALSARYESRRYLYRQTASVVEQLTLAEFIQQGELVKQARRLRNLYREKSVRLVESLRHAFGDAIEVEVPRSGVHCRVFFRGELPRERFIKAAALSGIGLRSEKVAERPGWTSWLLAFGQVPQEDFLKATQLLYRVYDRLVEEV